MSGSGAFTNPNDGAEPGPVLPGDTYSFDVYGNPGDRLSLATMLVQSNDWFFSPSDKGIPLYGDDGHFTIVVENVSGESDLPTPLAPGVFAVHQNPAPLFSLGQPDRGEGLEALAEDGAPGGLAEHLGLETGTATPLAPGVFSSNRGRNPLFRLGRPDQGNGLDALAEDGDPGQLAGYLEGVTGDSGAFTTPLGSNGPAPLLPGESYQFEVTSRPGERLHTASMFVQSNDWFFGNANCGLRLFRHGKPLEGHITSDFQLYDAGTEADQVTGFGPDQAPRQSGPDTGAVDPDDSVRIVQGDVSRYIKVSIRPVN